MKCNQLLICSFVESTKLLNKGKKMTTKNQNGIIIHEADIVNSYSFISANFPILNQDIEFNSCYPEMYVDAKMIKLPNSTSPIVIATFMFYDLIKSNLSKEINLSYSQVKPLFTKMTDVDDDIVEYSVRLNEVSGRVSISNTPYYMDWQFTSPQRVRLSHNYGSITLDEFEGIVVDEENQVLNQRASILRKEVEHINQKVAYECSITKVEREHLPNIPMPTVSVFPTLLKKQ